jgi:hypothetical protein
VEFTHLNQFVIKNLSMFVALLLLNFHIYELCGLFYTYMTPGTTFVGIVTGKASRDQTHLPGMPRGLKGLLHMLNAIVIPRKVA